MRSIRTLIKCVLSFLYLYHRTYKLIITLTTLLQHWSTKDIFTNHTESEFYWNSPLVIIEKKGPKEFHSAPISPLNGQRDTQIHHNRWFINIHWNLSLLMVKDRLLWIIWVSYQLHNLSNELTMWQHLEYLTRIFRRICVLTIAVVNTAFVRPPYTPVTINQTHTTHNNAVV